jgi:hypothetical protein
MKSPTVIQSFLSSPQAPYQFSEQIIQSEVTQQITTVILIEIKQNCDLLI